VNSARPLINSIFAGISVDILRYLVKELGADAKEARLKDGATPLYVAAQIGDLSSVQFLAKELCADVNQAGANETMPLYVAARRGHLAVVRCLVKEHGAEVNQGKEDSSTPLFIAAQNGNLAVVRLLVKELGADVNKAKQNGVTPLMVAAICEHEDVVTFLIKYGANVKDSGDYGTAADISRLHAMIGKQNLYLEARTYCAKPGCDGAGAKKCAGCLKVYYCTRECQLAHWPAHKAECRQNPDIAASKRT
jgi:ankyrin repeat protein